MLNINRIDRWVTVCSWPSSFFSVMVNDIKTVDRKNELGKFSNNQLTFGVPGNESGDTAQTDSTTYKLVD